MTVDLPPITAVWSALGGGRLISSRGVAFWRKGDGYNVSVNSERQAWYDFAAGVGGGVLDLVCVALNETSRKDAMQWLIDTFNLESAAASETPQERRARKLRREHIALWKQGCIDRLEEQQRRGLEADDMREVEYAAPRLRKLRSATPRQIEAWFDGQPATHRKSDIAAARRSQKVWDALCLEWARSVVYGNGAYVGGEGVNDGNQ